MKRNYLKPSMKIFVSRTPMILSSSAGVTSSDLGLQYGGIDDDGIIIPE